MSSVVGIYGSDGVVAGQNNTAPAVEVVIAASSEVTIDPTLSFVYRDQQAFSVEGYSNYIF